jgi:2-polyprenyl-6-methoxyphenol hydroxylase-like FAD-dependent oxidoreductase
VNADIVIAGAGPAGLMLACELGLAGADVLVLDPHPEPRRESAGMAINNASVELLDERGLLDAVRVGSMPLPAAHYSLIPLDMTRLTEPHEHTILVLQSRLEAVLEQRAVELGAQVRRGLTVTGLEQDEDGVTVWADGAGEPIRCRYLVGCDGRDSAVRTLAGIGFPGTDPAFHGLVGDVEIDFSTLTPEQIGAKYAPTGDHYTGAPLEPGLLRVITAEFEAAPPPADSPVTLEELRDAVWRLTGTELKPDAVRWLVRYGNPTRNAERYRDRRVFLAGDAAHVHFPLNGQALNNCLHDAANLGWKLAAVLAGTAAGDLLESYEAERRPVGERSCSSVAAQVALSYPAQKVAPLRAAVAELIAFDDVNRHLIDQVTGLGVRYQLSYPERPFGEDAHPLLGRRPAPVPLVHAAGPAAGEPARLADALRAGRGVLLDLSGKGALAGECAPWDGRVDVLAVEPTPALDAAALLLRPDGHVAWVARSADDADDADGLRQALTAWFGQPAA